MKKIIKAWAIIDKNSKKLIFWGLIQDDSSYAVYPLKKSAKKHMHPSRKIVPCEIKLL